ncbi:hypothetical protein DHEL01_v209949 [Diaporthe helianthi]|uniref:Uncharacterized protein n=1 Tax=Diaporthe helianthi TaxID=158607 RepID=A0A2P5HN49_DIAHE|nr:hypothetical protein DHEL01_v209949 [Diaporthe helianthi]
MVNDIMAERTESSFKVDQEHMATQWEPQLPNPDSMSDEDFQQRRDEYLRVCRSIGPYKSATSPQGWEYATQIILRRIEIFEDRLRGLKAHPGSFMQYLDDMRQHSHHEVQYSTDHIHPYANLADNQSNSRMWGVYLVRALHHATQGIEFWRAVMLNLDTWQRNPPGADDTEEDDPVGQVAYLVMLWVTLSNLMRMMESGADELISLKGEVLAAEFLDILQGRAGGTWMTNFGLEKAEEHHDAATIWNLLQRYWRYHGLDFIQPLVMANRLPDHLKWDNCLGATTKLREVNVDDIVAKHMVPYPAAQFEYHLLSHLKILPRPAPLGRTVPIHHLKGLQALLGQAVRIHHLKPPTLRDQLRRVLLHNN